MLSRSAFRNRHRNSGRQHEGKRFPLHLAWLRKRPCILDGMYGHVCEGRMEAHHISEGNGGMGLKGPDYDCIPVCSLAHQLVHNGKESFQRKYGIHLISAAQEYAQASPHRHLWESPR